MLVFLAAATLAFGVMAVVRVRGSVKRRAAGIGAASSESTAAATALAAHSSLQGARSG